MDVTSYLLGKDCEVKPANDNNISTHCFFCGEDTGKRGRLYINIDPSVEPYGLMFCHLCGTKGTFNTILKHFGDEPIKNASDTADDGTVPDDMFCEILDKAADFYYWALLEDPVAYDYVTIERGLTEATIKKFRLGWAAGGLITHLVKEGYAVEDIQATGLVNRFGSDFLTNKITIPYQVSGQVVCIRGKDIGGKYLTPPGQKARLFNVDTIVASLEKKELDTESQQTDVKPEPKVIAFAVPEVKKGPVPGQKLTAMELVPPPRNTHARQDSVIITEGEFDCMTLDQLGFTAVGVPGALSWQDAWTNYLSDSKRIYICFDNDDTGNSAAEKLASKLGAKTRIVSMPKALPGQKKIDVNSWMVDYGKTAEDFFDLFSRSKGGLLVSVYESYQKWSEIEGNPNLKGLRFNIPTLDAEMRHGLLPAQVITLLAKTGAGKTLAFINLFHRMSMDQDLKILFVSLEQTRNEWFERAHRINSFYNPEATLKDTVDYWSERMFLVDKNRITQRQLESCVDQFEYEMGRQPDFIAVDYLGYYARSFKGEEYARVTEAIMGLKEIAKDRELVVATASQSNRQGQFGKMLSADNAKASGAIEETSDMMIAIINPDQSVEGTSKQTRQVQYQVLKTRDGGLGHIAEMQFAPLTLAIVPQSEEKEYGRALLEKDWATSGDSYENAVYRYVTGDMSIYLGDK
jgi:5S rRNA maturation endonuclease (ribonuclease M5)/KaiC/GvpD/RAD55 family RecA-like ATPase